MDGHFKKLTLAEIAAVYRKSPKAFRKIVRDCDVPHEVCGRSMLFELPIVQAHFAARKAQAAKVVKFRPSVRKSRASKTKFAEAVGI